MHRAPVLVALAAVAGLALPAPANAELEFNLPAAIVYVYDTSLASELDPGRCMVAVMAEFPVIRHAKGYEIVVRRNDLGGSETQYVAPPFERGPWQQRFPPPRGFERFFIGSYSGPDGCADAQSKVEGNAEIVSAKVHLKRRFEKRFRKEQKPPYDCEGRTLDLKGWSSERRFVVVRRQGTVTTQDEGAEVRQNLPTNRYALAGTVIRTGKNSVVSIGTLDGNSVLVGPGTTVRLTPGGLEVLATPRDPGFTVQRPKGPYRVRCSSHVISARG